MLFARVARSIRSSRCASEPAGLPHRAVVVERASAAASTFLGERPLLWGTVAAVIVAVALVAARWSSRRRSPADQDQETVA